jgi:hypothetical protein
LKPTASPTAHLEEAAPLAALASVTSTVAFGSTFWWVACLKIGAAPWLLWSGLVLAFASSATYILIYWLRRAHTRSMPSPTILPSGERAVSDRRVAAAMVGIVGGSLSIGALRLQLWVALIPSLIVALAGWVASVVLWLRDQWVRPAR